MDAIGTIKKNGAFIYAGFDLQVPEPYFVDRTLDVDINQANIDCYDLKSMIAELNIVKPSLIPDVLCPWGCTEFCFQAKHFHLGLILQHHLRKVVLKFPRSKWYEKLHLVVLEECARANPDARIRPLTHASVDRTYQAESVGINSLVSILTVDPLIPGHGQTIPRSVSFTRQHHLNVARESSWLS